MAAGPAFSTASRQCRRYTDAGKRPESGFQFHTVEIFPGMMPSSNAPGRSNSSCDRTHITPRALGKDSSVREKGTSSKSYSGSRATKASRCSSFMSTSKAAATKDDPGLGSAESEAIWRDWSAHKLMIKCREPSAADQTLNIPGSTRPFVIRKICGCAKTRW